MKATLIIIRVKTRTHYFVPDIIDGNTGNVYEKEKNGINDTSENMKYNNVTWNGKT